VGQGNVFNQSMDLHQPLTPTPLHSLHLLSCCSLLVSQSLTVHSSLSPLSSCSCPTSHSCSLCIHSTCSSCCLCFMFLFKLTFSATVLLGLGVSSLIQGNPNQVSQNAPVKLFRTLSLSTLRPVPAYLRAPHLT
jgi:hypothetical protein